MGISLEKIEKWERKKNAKKLIRALGDDRVEIRVRATRALSAIDDPEITNYLIQLLRDENPEIRLASVETLGVIGSGRTVEFIRAMLDKERDIKVIEAAKHAMLQIKEKVKEREQTA